MCTAATCRCGPRHWRLEVHCRPSGIHRVVVSNDDPMQENRLEVTVADVDSSSVWATPSEDVRYNTPPDVGVNVWVEYENGDPLYPRWVGIA